MELYEVHWKKSAEKDLRKIDHKQIPRILKTIESFATNPFPFQYIKLRGTERLYRIRIGDYRIIYSVETEAKTVIIYYIRYAIEKMHIVCYRK